MVDRRGQHAVLGEHTLELAQHRLPVADVAEGELTRDHVDLVVVDPVERCFDVRLPELGVLTEAFACGSDHLLARVDAEHVCALFRQPRRVRGGAAGRV